MLLDYVILPNCSTCVVHEIVLPFIQILHILQFMQIFLRQVYCSTSYDVREYLNVLEAYSCITTVR